MKTVRITYFGVQGEGRTMREAKEDAGRKIERLVERHSPLIYAHKGRSVVITYHPDGASYTLIHPESSGRVCSRTCFTSAEDVEESAVKHLLNYDREVGDVSIPDWVPADWRKRILDDWRTNDGFQRAYRIARGMGMGDGEAHRWACDHGPEYVERVGQEITH